MSTAVTPSMTPQAQTPSPSGAAPTQGQPSSTPTGSPAPTAHPEWRAPLDHPQVWARGKTAEEILNIGGTMMGQLERLVSAPQPPQATPQHQGQPSYQQPNQPQYAPTQPQYDPGDFATYGAIQQMAPRVAEQAVQQVQQQFAPALQQNTEALANMALNMVRQNKPEVFAKYGHEIYGKLGTLPKHMWTVDNLNEVVNLVRGYHVDELVAEARQLASAMEPGGTLRSNGGAGTVPGGSLNADLTLQSEKLPAQWKAMADKVGLTEKTVDEWCAANSMSREQFFAQFGKSGIVTEIGKFTQNP